MTQTDVSPRALPRLVAFDLDDTLAPSKSAMPPAMATALRRLLDVVPVCIISGGQVGQFRDQVLAHLDADADELSRLHLMPTCGTRYYTYDPSRAQITFSALGQEAPLDAKRAWDPTGEKKAALRDAVAPLLPDLEVRSGGSTSVDITLKGVDKAYGMMRLAEMTGIALEEMIFVGDRLDPEGNDYPVKALGVPCQAVSGWQDTVAYVTSLASLIASDVHGGEDPAAQVSLGARL